MKPVDQTRFGFPDGNCFAACVASLLDIGIEDVPDLGNWDSDWTRPLNRWLAGRGLAYIEVDTSTSTPYYRLPADLLVLLSGLSPRHLKTVEGEPVEHCVVGRADGSAGGHHFDIVHDPHPSRDGLAGRVTSVAFLLKLDPSSAR